MISFRRPPSPQDHRCQRVADDRGSLPLAMLVSIIGVGLSAFMSTLVISQLHTTAFEARRVQALHASQAGLDVGLAQVRAATKIDSSGATVGDTTKLPCTALTGTVGAAAYSVTAAYYDADPQGHLPDSTWVSTHGVLCAAGHGTRTVPDFVVFTSTGTATDAGSSSRTLRGTYVVHTSNANISGGLVHVYRGNTTLNDLCIDAGSGDPAAGTAATMQLCNAGAVAQTWSYNGNLQFQLVSSQTPSRLAGMCLDAGATHAVNNPVVLQPCQTTTPGLYRQQWSINDSSNLVGSNSTGTDVDSYCFNVASANTPGSALIITTSCNGSYNNVSTFSVDANVGAGQASSPVGQAIGQLVNFNQFGRCLDDTGQNPDATYMIAWPCKQNPNASKVAWNQRYTLPALPAAASVANKADNHGTGTITTKGALYCLQSPMSPDLYQYVTTKACTKATNQQWTVYGKTDLYATSYQIVDGTGRYCLQPRDVNADPADLFQAVNKVAKIYVAPCDGSTLQKWNADKNEIGAIALKDVTEK
jgi:hypothetical protein